MTKRVLALLITLFGSLHLVSAEVHWKDALRQSPDWYSTTEAIRIADGVLIYQRASGGWPKNIDMALSLSDADTAKLLEQKHDRDSTIDNGTTYTQLRFLARVFTATHLDRFRTAFLSGFDYLLTAQYANGGWPQFYPDLSGYFKHITYNDDAMIGVMELMRDVAAKNSDYNFVDEARRHKALVAVQKGIDCVLKTQIIVAGKRTVWCAQHDEITLAPAKARTYELPSFSGGESVGIVRFLMSIEKPAPDVIEAIDAAIAWFEKSKLTGIKWISKPDASKLHGFDRVVVSDSSAGPLWARFYELETNRPIFVGRDGIIKYSVAEIEDERRNGYAWYVSSAADLLSKDYPAWLKNHSHHVAAN